MRFIISIEELNANLENIGDKVIHSEEIDVVPSIFSWKNFTEEIGGLIEGWHTLSYSEKKITVNLIISEPEKTHYDEKLIQDIKSVLKNNFEKKEMELPEHTEPPEYMDHLNHLETSRYFIFQGGWGVDLELEKILEKNNIKIIDREHQADEVGASGGFFSLDLFVDAIEFIKLVKDLYDIGIILIPMSLKARKGTMTITNYEIAVKHICEEEKIYPDSIDNISSQRFQKVDHFVFTQNITKRKYEVDIKDGEVIRYKKI